MRNIFIRVTCENLNRNNELILYKEEDIKNMIFELAETVKFSGTIYYVKHEPDGIHYIEPHFHILIESLNNIDFFTLKGIFRYGDIQECRDVFDCFRYLTHWGYPKKEQYDIKKIKTIYSYYGEVKEV